MTFGVSEAEPIPYPRIDFGRTLAMAIASLALIGGAVACSDESEPETAVANEQTTYPPTTAETVIELPSISAALRANDLQAAGNAFIQMTNSWLATKDPQVFEEFCPYAEPTCLQLIEQSMETELGYYDVTSIQPGESAPKWIYPDWAGGPLNGDIAGTKNYWLDLTPGTTYFSQDGRTLGVEVQIIQDQSTYAITMGVLNVWIGPYPS